MERKEHKVAIEKLQGHNCFACGTANPIGLNLEFYRLGDRVCADFIPHKNHEGWENITHGGIVSTLLDEVMSWTVITLKKTLLLTRKMELKYVRPVPVGMPLGVSGRLVDGVSEPLVRVRGEIRDSEDRLLVKSTGEFVMVTAEKLSDVPEGLKEDMAALFNRLD
ncbi:MAG: PaaI family thioesterase [Desulfobacteraceae bacterium]